ncbi:MAG: multiheme c-type cytochrome [Acidobacteriota bacterium]
MCGQAGEGLIQDERVYWKTLCLPLGALVLVVLPQVGCQGGFFSKSERQHLRQARRAYDGVPPIIPHAVGALGREDCLDCHEKGLDLNEHGLASSTPHPQYVNCRQCHLEQNTGVRLLVNNSFQGYRHPPHGTRPYPAAPPTIPHPLTMRENCLGCHGALGGSPIHTPHPDRVNCRQCHLPQSSVSPPFTNRWREGNGKR